MAESKFLRHQDPSGDGLPDVCDEFVAVEEPLCEDCKCIKNGAAITPNWRSLDSEESFLNYKNCLYQVAIETKYTTTIDESLLEKEDLTDTEEAEGMAARYEEYAEQAITALLEENNKDTGAAALRSMSVALQNTDYDLAARPKSRLRLLYSIPYHDLCSLDDAADEEDTDDAEEEGAEVEVTYEIQDLKAKLIVVRKGLFLYGRYLRVYRSIDKGNLFFQDGDAAGKVFPLFDYGDRGILGGSTMAKILPQLDNFLNTKGYNIRGVDVHGSCRAGFINLYRDKVETVTFTFTKEYELKKLTLYTQGCGEENPIIFIDKLKRLKKKSAWKDPTAMAYLVQLNEMTVQLQAREPVPWLEFVKKYTYPTIYSSVNQGYANTDPDNTGASCIADALQNEAKQFGEDILDPIFSIGDAIAYRFHENICREKSEEVIQDEVDVGLFWSPKKKSSPEGASQGSQEGPTTTSIIYTDVEGVEVPAAKNKDGSRKQVLKTLSDMAAEQAGQTIGMDDATFDEFCEKVINDSVGFDLEELWEEGFNKIKLCGLYSLMIDSVKCLFAGLTLEEMLSTVTESALRTMSLENFGNLFIGLPPDKQAELDALVKKKFENGEFFAGGTSAGQQEIADAPPFSLEGKLDFTKPCKDKKLVKYQEEEQMQPGPTGETSVPASPIKEASDDTRRTLAKQLDPSSAAKKQLNPNNVFEAYILALLEVYSENYFELLAELNKFPGAQLIATLIAIFDCPKSPILDPSAFDFIKDIQLPFCRNSNDITWPALANESGWFPGTKDISGALFVAIQFAIQKLVVTLLMKLMIKICGTLGSAACAAPSIIGAAMSGNNMADLIKDSLCPDADAEQIDNTIVDMFANLGLGATAFANTEQVIDFAGDISSAVTRAELARAFLGECSSEFLTVVDSLIVYEYPDFRAGLSNKKNICSFFGDMGNLMPSDFREQLRNFAEGLPENDGLPANPSLCATPQQIETFNQLRSDILDGRATPQQIEKLGDRSGPLEDLKDLAGVLQGGPTRYLADNLPPLISDPGCDNGLLPYESEEAKATTVSALGGSLEQLKIDFAYDMLGNGPSSGRWGLINMILSDTMGNPLTAHMRKAYNQNDYVDYYTDTSVDADVTLDDDSTVGTAGGWFDISAAGLVADIITPRVSRTSQQRGAFPYKVADWLEEYMQTNLTASFASNNEIQKDIKSDPISFASASIKTFGSGINLLKLPDLGYNVDTRIKFEDKEIYFLEKARKKDPDLTLSFQDNCKGLWDDDEIDSMFSYGFDLEFYLSDLVSGSTEGIHNRVGDNARIKIWDRYNTAARTDTTLAASIPDLLKYYKPLQYKISKMILKPDNKKITDSYERKFEFLATDNILDEIDLAPYPKFVSTFSRQQSYLPQIVLLDELIGAGTIEKRDIKSGYDSIMSDVTEQLISVIANNEDAFLYGAVYDDLSFDDVQYVVDEGQTESDGGTNYYEALVDDGEGGTRTIKNDDQIMGISLMQYMSGSDENRVMYLDPNTFGGSYMNPPLYVKPLENKGWMGFVEAMFPEISPCKPYRTDIIDFEDIQQKIENSYPTIPEDQRLKSDPNCIIEVPYGRILERPSVAGLESVITATLRIYASTFFIKSLATFTKIYPKFPDTFSSLYAAYIVEEMEASLKDAQKAFWEAFNPFKDTKFWYAFLEQSVQLYSRRVDNGEISDPPTAAVEALSHLNDVQENYPYPNKNTLKKARGTGEAGAFESLKHFRQDKNLEAIQASEEYAKVILKEMVVEQLNYMGEKFIENFKNVGMSPDIFDLNYFIFQSLSQGGESLTLDQEIKEEYADLPTEGDEHYTSGGSFALPDGTEYVGYYFVKTDEEGNPTYAVGEFEVEGVEDEILTPFANQIIVPIGDIDELGVSTESSTSKPFVIEKYISINGTAYAPSTAVSMIQDNDDLAKNISDVYPGTLETVTAPSGRIVGLEGELGVRHGLRFSAIISGTTATLVEVEIDALDVQLSKVDPLAGDSKLLLCLINMLKADDKFRLVAEYIFPLRKITATLAIYNGLAFLPSIGEKVVKDNQTIGKYYWGEADELPSIADRSKNTIYTKPGVALTFDSGGNIAIYPPDYAGPNTPTDEESVTVTDADGNATDYDLSRPNGGGWSSKLDRDPGVGGGLFVKEWDNWDQTLLRNSKSRIKKMFKGYYNSREFDAAQTDDSADSPGTVVTNEFKERFKKPTGQNLLPFWKRRMLRTNPFNASGELCEEKD